ncbi:cell division protein FtsA [Candidatus Saccharibacteria bacterium CG_4_10_14_0_2_um_filter_52_9]|nr:MAG: cell division protein FtsA [Candidatus Saccharibacteria bacterium CG_4_10_14_0_2_um_filter_52_9]
MKPEHFIGLDIGTSTVRCVVGTFDPNGSNAPSIIGHGQAPNQGMRRGAVVHVDDVADAIVHAVTEAERISGMSIKHATVNVNGSHVGGLNSEGVIAISAANREITAEDRLRVEEAATIVSLPPNREIVQFFAKNYSLDGQRNIKDPVGMHGVRLEVDAHIVTAASPNLRSLDMALEKAEIRATHHTVSGLAAAEAVLTRQQKEAGTALLDIGAGTTNLIVFEDGEVQYVAVIPMGGQHITNDLAIGLKTDLDIAEAVKVKHANLKAAAKGGGVTVKVGDQTHNFDSEEISMIVEARVDELLEYVDKELQKIKRSRKLPGGVVITGGTSKLPGLDEFAREKLQLSARIGKLHNIGGLVDTVEDATFTTVVGLMLLDMLLLPSLPPNSVGSRGTDTAKALVSNLWHRFKR